MLNEVFASVRNESQFAPTRVRVAADPAQRQVRLLRGLLMAKSNWEVLTSPDSLAAIGVSSKRGRGWRILSAILLIGSATFMFAYHLPLHRAHARLNAEYGTLAQRAKSDHRHLADAVKALQAIKQERDTFADADRARETRANQSAARTEKLERELRSKLQGDVARKRIAIERRADTLLVSLSATSLLSADGATVSDAGSKALCQVATAAKLIGAFHMHARSAASAEELARAKGSPSTFHLSASRAASAASTLVEQCGVDAGAVSAVAEHAPTASAAAAASATRALVTLELGQPRSTPDAGHR
jgi:chemotaxis protein MotB